MTTRSKKRSQPRAIAILTDDTEWKAAPAVIRLVRRAAGLALAEAKRTGGVTILLTGDTRVAELNAQFRGQNRPTNVLAFPSDDAGYLGDVAIAHGVVAREAREQGKTFANHAAHLAIHGVLHLLGHDHMIERDAKAMEAIEVRILAKLGIADPYAMRKAA